MQSVIGIDKHLKKKIFESLNELVGLVFPNNCLSCDSELSSAEKHFCVHCEMNLNRTYFETYQESSSLDKLFWGRVKIENTFALYYFNADSPIRKILHELKYQHKERLGVYLGENIGSAINENQKFKDLDALIPVPIHHKKKFIRGYNQSELIAQGLAKQINVPVLKEHVLKTRHTQSQTRKSNIERWENVSNLFKSIDLSGVNHIAIVDDVITTGSTIESLAKEMLNQNKHLKISLISLAFAKS